MQGENLGRRTGGGRLCHVTLAGIQSQAYSQDCSWMDGLIDRWPEWGGGARPAWRQYAYYHMEGFRMLGVDLPA